MTVEEKAKAYDEAKARMSIAYNSNRCTIGFMNEIFPEFKMNEDERIRKGITELVKQSSEILDKKNQERMLAWLEKQVSPQMVADAYLRGCNDTEKKWLEKQEEQKQQCKSTTISSSDITTITTATNEKEYFTH